MSGLVTLITAFLTKHAAILIGLLIGSAAKFGYQISTGQNVKLRDLTGHILMMGMVGMFTVITMDAVGIKGGNDNIRTYTAAIFALSVNDVIRYLRDKAAQKMIGSYAELHKVPPLTPSQEAIVEEVTKKDPQALSDKNIVEAPLPANVIELIAQLDAATRGRSKDKPE